MHFASKVSLAAADALMDEDEVLNELLIRTNFAGSISEAVIANLWVYGHKNILILIRTDQVFDRCADFGRPVSRSYHWSFASEETRLELTDETVISGLRLFKTQILEKKWRADGGASMKTYFLNACLLSFPNAYRWMKTREERAAEPLDEAQLHGLVHRASQRLRSKESLYGEYDLLRQELARREPTLRAVVAYIAQGYTAREAAERLGTSIRSIESAILRIRASLNTARLNPDGPQHELRSQNVEPDDEYRVATKIAFEDVEYFS